MAESHSGRTLGEAISRKGLAGPVRVFWVLAFTALGAHALHTAFGIGGPSLEAFFANWVYDGLILGAALACLTRAVIVPAERAAWVAFGLGLLAWTGGEVYYTLFLADLAVTPFPSPSDVFFIAFYPACFYGIVLLARTRLRQVGASLWLDGLVATLTASAVATALVYKDVVGSLTGLGDFWSVAVNLAYPLGDVLLLGSVAGVLALTGWRPGRSFALIGSGLALTAIADGVYLHQTAAQTYVEGTLLDTMWPAAMLLVGFAAWQSARSEEVSTTGWRVLALPLLFSLTAVGLLVIDQLHRLNKSAVGLATAAVIAVLARMAWSLSENVRMLVLTRTAATTDSLTGLGNRRQLMTDLDRELDTATQANPRALMIFDLDGFKGYNDAFGHPAGDALLVRLGGHLEAAVGPYGRSYRLGGDEFCALVRAPAGELETIRALASKALDEQGEGFSITSSCGMVLLPEEANTTSAALQLADQRMYARKHGRPSATRRQLAAVLLRVLSQRNPELHDHVRSVSDLAQKIGLRLGISGEELDELMRAAELHDVGKIAIPDAILSKPGALTEEERNFVENHTILGEYVLNAAPALAPVGRLVRSSHERWDGQGYPDGLAGEEIPLGARVLAVSDAFHAMISDRPYPPLLSVSKATEELRRCSGTQFDPAVVDACCAVLAESVAQSRAIPDASAPASPASKSPAGDGSGERATAR